jgi:hypothetical protein
MGCPLVLAIPMPAPYVDRAPVQPRGPSTRQNQGLGHQPPRVAGCIPNPGRRSARPGLTAPPASSGGEHPGASPRNASKSPEEAPGRAPRGVRFGRQEGSSLARPHEINSAAAGRPLRTAATESSKFSRVRRAPAPLSGTRSTEHDLDAVRSVRGHGGVRITEPELEVPRLAGSNGRRRGNIIPSHGVAPSTNGIRQVYLASVGNV